MNRNKTLGIVLGVFALVIVTTGASFAFFQYQRTGNTKVNVTSGDITFSYMEDNQNASLANAFPVADSVGAVDITGEYEFTVSMTSSSSTTVTKYNVILLDNNKGESNYFTNDQIKFALVKNNVYVADTSATKGLKLSEVSGFTSTLITGEGTILSEQEITSGTTDTYKLRIWISDDVSYNTTITEGQETGKYNRYTYSLRVKVTSETINNSTAIENVNVTDEGVITASISDPKGLKAYAVTTSSTAPANSSNDWINVTDTTAMNESNIQRMSNSLITSKTISYTAAETGTYYIHVKNNNDEVSKRQVSVLSILSYAQPGLATTSIINFATTASGSKELRIDNHAATEQTAATIEYRYYGATPNNYVTFNNESWRIIGVFDADDGEGNVQKRVKIIRDQSIGNMAWDTNENEWATSTLNTYLNGEYFTSLSSTAQAMIGNTVYYLGGLTYNLTKDATYAGERGKTVYLGRSTKATSKIALMYLSDYLYASPATCTQTSGGGAFNTTGCYDSDYLFNGTYYWTLSPFSSRGDCTFYVRGSGYVNNDFVNNSNFGVHPVAYLASNIEIESGTGTSTDPFILK